MTRGELFEKRRRKRRAKVIRKGVIAGGAVLLVLLLVFVVRAAIISGRNSVEGSRDNAAEEDIEQSVADTNTATLIDGSPDVGDVGWNMDDSGWWYKTEDNKIYTNGWQELDGERYYFNDQGRLLTGWNYLNDGSYVCFSDSGVYMPDKQPINIALTFDDGPSRFTDRILDALEANHAKATFFVVGSQAEGDEISRNAMIRAYNMGMEIGSHTWEHIDLYGSSPEAIATTMDRNDQYLQSVLGFTPKIMRPTGGGIDDNVRNTVNKPMINWDVDTLDWETKDAQNTYNVILDEVKEGSIVLMHDIYEQTAVAAEMVIPELVNRGYRLLTVSELAELKGVTLEPHQKYTDFVDWDAYYASRDAAE
ncbi:MAG: polysaccharide deacetylase family protein [Lachnospiraceae bacterium]|nr:polysaccharide deacetylase family protein [Candidatus Equihabitans merdae]